MIKTKQIRKREEILNSSTHAVGIGLAIAATVILVVHGALNGTVWHVVSYSIFGAGLINLYTASTIFHAAINPRKKVLLNRFDHSSIYILIAATYTPLALISLRGALGWVLFGVLWAVAIAGVVYKVWFYSVKFRKLSAWLYIFMGWFGLAFIYPIIKSVPNIALWFLLAGCLTYSLGVIFYLKDKYPYVHGIFHLFIIFGSVCHFFALYFLV